MENPGVKISRKRIEKITGVVVAAQMGVKIIDVLRQQDGGDARGTGGLLKNRVVFREKVLRLVNEHEYRPGIVSEILPPLDGALNQILERALNQNARIAVVFNW